MAYIFKKKEDVVEYLRQMEFTFGDEYSHYIVPRHMYTTRFDIFYKGTNCGFVENENFNEVSSNVWTINIPTEKRSFLEAEQPGLYEAIYTEPTNADGDIDKKYYIDPKAFTRIIVKDSNNNSHQILANGPGSYFGLKFSNDFVKVDDTEIAKGTTQVNINIDSKALANKLRFDLAELVGNYTSTEPGAISVKNVAEYPSIVVATSMDERPRWVPLSDIEVKRAAVATKAESLETPELGKQITFDDLITKNNFTENFTRIIENSSPYGINFKTEFNAETGEENTYIFARDYNVNLVGDISGTARFKDFENVDIDCTLAPTAIEKLANRTGKSITFGTEKFTINNLDITYDDDRNVVFNIPEDKTYKFNINDNLAFTINTGGGNDIAEEFESDPDLQYSDGDLVGICSDGLIRPMAYDPVSYIGVVTTNPAVICGSIKSNNKVLVALTGKKTCYIKTSSADLHKLIGRKVIASTEGDNAFTLYDNVFDRDKGFNGIIIGSVYPTQRAGFVKAVVLLK